MSGALRVAFVGAVEGSLIGLRALIDAKLPPGLVITLPPEAAKRHSDFADIATPATKAGSRVAFARNINAPETLAVLEEFSPDLCLVIGWSQICGPAFLSAVDHNAIGFHPAPLPRMRGRAVIPWTILMDEKRSGSSLFWLDEGTDSGPIVLQRIFDLADDETARSLYDRHTANLTAMLPEAVRLVADGKAPRQQQDHTLATYCAKRTPEDGRIDWSRPASEILRLIRAVGDPYPDAFTNVSDQVLSIAAAAAYDKSERYVGVAGQLQARSEDALIVRCGDGQCIEISSWTWDGEKPPPMHTVFGR